MPNSIMTLVVWIFSYAILLDSLVSLTPINDKPLDEPSTNTATVDDLVHSNHSNNTVTSRRTDGEEAGHETTRRLGGLENALAATRSLNYLELVNLYKTMYGSEALTIALNYVQPRSRVSNWTGAFAHQGGLALNYATKTGKGKGRPKLPGQFEEDRVTAGTDACPIDDCFCVDICAKDKKCDKCFKKFKELCETYGCDPAGDAAEKIRVQKEENKFVEECEKLGCNKNVNRNTLKEYDGIIRPCFKKEPKACQVPCQKENHDVPSKCPRPDVCEKKGCNKEIKPTTADGEKVFDSCIELQCPMSKLKF